MRGHRYSIFTPAALTTSAHLTRCARVKAVKASGLSELKIAVLKFLKGELYLSPLIARDSVRGLIQSHAARAKQEHHLSGRQKQVLQLLAEGKPFKEVANQLNIAPRTVGFHKYRMMESLGITTNAELIRYALKQRLIAA